MKRDHHSLRQQKGAFKFKSDANALDMLVFTSLSSLENIDVIYMSYFYMFLQQSLSCFHMWENTNPNGIIVSFAYLFSFFGIFFMELCLILNQTLYKFYYLVIKAGQ